MEIKKYCSICGKEVVPEVDSETRFTGHVQYICYGCLKRGNKQVIQFRADYFNSTSEGRKRLKNSKKKRRGK